MKLPLRVGSGLLLLAIAAPALAQDDGAPSRSGEVAAVLAAQKLPYCVFNDHVFTIGAVISTPIPMPGKTAVVVQVCGEDPAPLPATGRRGVWMACKLSVDSAGAVVDVPKCT